MRGRLAIFLTIALMLIVLVALNAASYVRVERRPDTEASPDRSTTNAGGTGTRALYEYLQQSGRRVVRWGEPATRLGSKDSPQISTFVIIGELRLPFSEEDAASLLLWVRDGGRLVLIDRAPPSELRPVSGDWRVAAEMVEYPDRELRPDDVESMTRGVTPLAPAQPSALTYDVQQVARSRFAARLRIVASAEKQPVETFNAPRRRDASRTPPVVEREEGSEDDAEPPPPPRPAPSNSRRPPPKIPEAVTPPPGVSPAPVVHFADGRTGGGALLVDYAYGRGRIILLSDPYIVSNSGINRADNLQLAQNVVAGAGGLIAFDEYHLGYGATQNRMFAYFAGTPILAICAQVAVVILAVLWTRGRRFARPLPAPHVDRRSNLEFVASMAELQQRARAYDLAIENIYGRTRRALARYGGTTPDATRQEIAARVGARSGKDAARIEELMRECEDAINGAPIKAQKALALIASLRELERELGILMRSREIRQITR